MRSKPLELIAGACIFSTAAAGGAISHVASTSLAILLITSLILSRNWVSAWRELSPEVRILLITLAAYFLSAVLSYINVMDDREFIKHLGKYVRFLLIIPIYLVLSRSGFRLFRYLFYGAVVSGPVYLITALISISENPGHPAGGGYHHITFGDMAMLGAMFLTTVLFMMKTSRGMKIVLLLSIASLLYASILSTARGAWLAMPFCLLAMMVTGIIYNKIKLRNLLALILVVMTLVIVVSPVNKIITDRINQATIDIEKFQQGGEGHGTSVGARFVMWHVAVNVWKKYPLIGTGPGDFDLEMERSNEEGLYENIHYAQSSAHNIYFQALATTGTIGFLLLIFALFLLPLRVFVKSNQRDVNIASFSGIVVITAFAVFGLTESWTLRAPVISVFLIYMTTLLNAATNEQELELRI